MKPVSLADISYEQGLELLSLRKQALDSGEAKRLPSEVLRKSQMLQSIGEKAAAEGGFLDSITSSFKNMDPGVKRTLLSGATGAGLGAIGGAFADNKNRLRNALMGGIAGGALGGGIGLATNRGVLDKAIDAAVPSAKDRARDALKPSSSAPSGPAKPGKLDDFGIDMSPERMAEIEANRLPNIADPLDNNLSQVEPYATGGGAMGLGAYLKGKLAPQVEDAEQLASKFTSSFIDPKLDDLSKAVLDSPQIKNLANKIPAEALTDPKLLQELLESGKVSRKDLSAVLSSFNNMLGSNPGNADPQAIKTLLNQLNLSKSEFDAIPTKSLGFRGAAKNLASGGKQNLLKNLKNLGLLAVPAGLLGYGAYRLGGGALNQAKNEIVWNQLKNRLERVAE